MFVHLLLKLGPVQFDIETRTNVSGGQFIKPQEDHCKLSESNTPCEGFIIRSFSTSVIQPPCDFHPTSLFRGFGVSHCTCMYMQLE